MALPMSSATRSFCDTVRGGKKTCVYSTAKATATQPSQAMTMATSHCRSALWNKRAASKPSGT